MNRKILVTGADGQLGRCLADHSVNSTNSFIFTDIDTLDITDKAQCEKILENNFDYIINAAAYTNVDGAELDKVSATAINYTGVTNLIEAAKNKKTCIIQISTDYVFSTSNGIPHREYEPLPDLASVPNVYGQTKLMAEDFILKNARRGIIIRTAWLYSQYGVNFLKTIMSLGRQHEEIVVISDQIGTPTSANDFARILICLTEAPLPRAIKKYHFTNSGVASWYDFAVAIMELANISCKVNPCRTLDYKTTAKRPHYSVLNTSILGTQFNIKPPHWRVSLQETIGLLSELETKK